MATTGTSVAPGQPQIEDHEVVVLRRQRVVGFISVVHAVHRKIGVAQRARKPVGQHRVVFRDQDAHACLAESEKVSP